MVDEVHKGGEENLELSAYASCRPPCMVDEVHKGGEEPARGRRPSPAYMGTMTTVVMFVDGWSVVGARDMAQVIVVVGGGARSWASACGRRRDVARSLADGIGRRQRRD